MALARAIVIQPRVLLFDEPLSNLDAKLRVQMRNEIRELQQRLGITTLYVTHDQEEAMAVSDRIAVMSQGRVVQEARREDLYHRPAIGVRRDVRRAREPRAGRVVEMDGGEAQVEALGTTLAVRAVRPRRRRSATRCGSWCGPRRSRSCRHGAGAAGATVASRAFLGEKIEYQLRCGDTTLQAVRYNAGPGDVIAEGAAVRLRVVEEALAAAAGRAR